MKVISLLNSKKEEIAFISQENADLCITVADKFQNLKSDMERLLEFVQEQKVLTVRSSVEQDGAIIEVLNTVRAGDDGYLSAVAGFINRKKLHPLRIFAVLRDKGGK